MLSGYASKCDIIVVKFGVHTLVYFPIIIIKLRRSKLKITLSYCITVDYFNFTFKRWNKQIFSYSGEFYVHTLLDIQSTLIKYGLGKRRIMLTSNITANYFMKWTYMNLSWSNFITHTSFDLKISSLKIGRSRLRTSLSYHITVDYFVSWNELYTSRYTLPHYGKIVLNH